VDVLAFHTMGRSKYERLGIPFPLGGTPPPTRDQLEAARAVFAARGLSVS
jgi:pyruvate formate lyase activating enzyme